MSTLSGLPQIENSNVEVNLPNIESNRNTPSKIAKQANLILMKDPYNSNNNGTKIPPKMNEKSPLPRYPRKNSKQTNRVQMS